MLQFDFLIAAKFIHLIPDIIFKALALLFSVPLSLIQNGCMFFFSIALIENGHKITAPSPMRNEMQWIIAGKQLYEGFHFLAINVLLSGTNYP